MTSSKHPRAGTAESVPPLPDDLERDPGINASKGSFARSDASPEIIKGENTTEGDVMNGTDASGGAGSAKERTNK